MPDQFDPALTTPRPKSPADRLEAAFKAKYVATAAPAAPLPEDDGGTRVGDYTRLFAMGLDSLGVLGGKAIGALGMEETGQADPVFQLGKAFIRFRGRIRPPGQAIKLVGQENKAGSPGGEKKPLPA